MEAVRDPDGRRAGLSAYYRLRLAGADRSWVAAEERRLEARYPPLPASVPVHETSDPNYEATRRFLESVAPDLALARCKSLLRKEIFEIPPDGTIVLHPGICPEYRNAHGCFSVRPGVTFTASAPPCCASTRASTGPIDAFYQPEIDERTSPTW